MKENAFSESMIITPETLKKLPAFVAEMVADYATADEGQRWRLRNLDFDLNTLDPLPIDEQSTWEIWTSAWVWHGYMGAISLSPHLAPPTPTEAFAWIVERENETAEQHITVWRVLIPEEQADSLFPTSLMDQQCSPRVSFPLELSPELTAVIESSNIAYTLFTENFSISIERITHIVQQLQHMFQKQLVTNRHVLAVLLGICS